MPFYRHPQTWVPIFIDAERRSVKNGIHHAVFTRNWGKYVGDWKTDKKEGKGLFLTKDGHLYEGDWLKGFRHGFGALSQRLPNGTYRLEYRGDWQRGKFHGVGWYYLPDGDVYFGRFSRGNRHGYGKMWHKDGTYYVGYWNRNRREGIGMFVQDRNSAENGNRYEGNWEGHRKSGLGRFYHLHTGQLQEGVWLDDVCVKSKMSDILVRQFCALPTEHPIPPVELRDALKLLEQSELWLNARLGDIDNKLRFCIDQMD